MISVARPGIMYEGISKSLGMTPKEHYIMIDLDRLEEETSWRCKPLMSILW